jgi:AsnC-type helix-turn-helix domain
MPARLDRVDLKMLRLLQNSGRLSNAELAEMVGVSPATCHRRPGVRQTRTFFVMKEVVDNAPLEF